ncbi:MAG: Glycosyl transferase family 2 [Candidatus Amesbacteria bacterium GW2011_GWB1_47_19]|nr:MAG: Glycosyl transferase family 2 [Candidatus Amesbacteria bacterium GW2011_GWA1_44_24]KKU31738.1 MAG: seg [Candidatus Amesbacteria bacterium GW2011_GWC1_46_24]KKU67651.1 MAG: Glycosyl transferase family 2 [Candidatus Amesbacteria bacterium GW2011_GWB1_47_19]OGD06501.1 MAG: hypothetical protein A2379_02565 [Candidatus Amesbacteria bacterium RIFOXYB1_FULL_47_13]HBC72904.1 hypothetical protein [Candidatus Amesbacteria bacterium]
MTGPSLTVHCLVKNEQRWIWFALKSILDYADEILVWDTGSTDRTVETVNGLNSPKIKFKQMAVSSPEEHTALRQQMLKATHSDWFFILDGDEVWWRESVRQVREAIKNNPGMAGIITPFYNAVGDVFHHQTPDAIHYRIHEFFGGFTIRAINRRLPGLHLANPHGRQEYRTRGIALQNLPRHRLLFVDAPYLHLTHLHRSVGRSHDRSTLKRVMKYRYELGTNFPHDFVFPDVFYLTRSDTAPSPFIRRSVFYTTIAAAITPLRWIKSRVTPHRESY